MRPVFTTRIATSDDHDALGTILYRAVHEGDSPYTPAQRAAWMPRQNAGAAWSARLAPHHVILGSLRDAPVGFMTLDQTGYIDLAYILPAARGQGLFAALLHEIETRAEVVGITRLWTHASLMAEPAFARHGFSVVQRETVNRAGETLRRAEMEKTQRITNLA